MMLVNIDASGTTTLLCTTSTIDDTVQDNDSKTTTYACLASTVTSSGGISSQHIDVKMANNYIDSLSDTQIVQLEQMLAEKEDMFATLGQMQGEIAPLDQNNMHVETLGKKQNSPQKNNKPKVYQKINKI